MSFISVWHPQPLAFARALVRWTEWYDSKIAFLLVCMYYAALAQPGPSGRLQGEMALLLAALCAYASFGHLVNDFSDRQADRVAGKRNVLATLSERNAWALVIVAGAAGLALSYWQRPGAIASLGAAYVLAAAYSLPPLRLKERGAAGLAAAALAQRTLPCVVVFYALDFWDWTAVALCVLSTLTGLRYIVVHQILDASNDARAGLTTFGTAHDARSLSAILTRWLFPFELASLGGTILLMGWSVPAVWAMALLYAVWLIVQHRRQPHRPLSPVSYRLLADLYFVYWPLLLAVLLALHDVAFVGVLVFTIVWLRRNLSLLMVNVIEVLAGRTTPPAPSPASGQASRDDKTFEHAVVFHDLGQLEKAQGLYEKLLREQPDHFGALCRFGIIQLQWGRFEKAERLLRRALKVDRKSADAQHALACALMGLGHAAEAIDHYQAAIAVRPDFPEAHNNIGYAFQVTGRHDEMMAHYQRALAIRPQYAEARNNIGNALHVLGRSEEALAHYHAAIAIRPDYAEAYWNIGNALRALGRIEPAIAQYRTALKLRPNFAEAYNSLGSALHLLGEHQQAVAEYTKALQIRPDYLDAHINLGNTLGSMERLEQAIAQYDNALSIQPKSIEALNGRGTAQLRLAAYDAAWDSFQAALMIDPKSAPALSGLARAAAAACDWQRTAQLTRDLLPRIANADAVIEPFTFLHYCGDPALQLTCARTYARDQMPIVPQPLWTQGIWRNEKIRIAYVAAGLHRHPNAFLSVELFESHDRQRFEVIGVSTGPDEDSEMRRRIVKAFDRFYDVRVSGDRGIAELINSMQVDIVVDRSGYTTNARPGMFASRPAPIQVNYLGYPGTLGTDFFDYVIADATVLPFDQQKFYSEKIVHLPDCYQSNDSQRAIAASSMTREQAGLPPQGFVFCCFNNPAKITAQIFAVWMRLLHRVPQSTLWLLSGGEVAAENVSREAATRGVDPKRVVFAPWIEPGAHLARHRLADLFLDTLPFNAHTTASDALWAGLPVITCYGECFAGRVAASLLKAVGLPELVCKNLQDYEALALRLATEPPLLAAFRNRLAENRLSQPLFDTRRYRDHIEAAYAEMWQIWQRGESPRSFAVAPVTQDRGRREASEGA
jgi:predicted O-linked N-acetylglucosamine transferase (SPINDLY family)/4-hydroxybenzoate polyprenyltransferase